MMLFPTPRGLPALFQEWRENFGQMFPAADSILVNCPLAGRILFRELGIQTVTLMGNFLPKPITCCGSDYAVWHGKSRAMGNRSPGKSSTLFWQHLPTDALFDPGQWLSRGIITPEWNENLWPSEHSVRHFFPSPGSYWRSKHYYGWRRWENEKRGRGRRLYCWSGSLTWHVSLAVSACGTRSSARRRSGAKAPGGSRRTPLPGRRQRRRRRPGSPWWGPPGTAQPPAPSSEGCADWELSAGARYS